MIRTLWSSGSQPGVRVPKEECDMVTGGMQNYEKMVKRSPFG
jgi:hypothetical protein